MKEPKFKPVNIYKPGSRKYYRDTLETIVAIGSDYDGYNPKSAKQMKELLDELVKIAVDGLNHEKMYFELEK